MAIRIVTDSTCDMPADVAAELGITVIPDYINAGDQSYQDGVDLTRREFYERLPGWRVPPTTAAPGVDAFRRVYERLADEGATSILSLHVYDHLSNLANVARLAAAATHSVAVTVLPGSLLSLGGGFIAMGAARAARAGRSLEEVMRVVEDLGQRTYIFASLDTLEFLRRSGRVPHLLARLGSWLNILPLLKVHCGEIGMDLVRTRGRGVERVIRLVEGLGPLERLGVIHTNAPERARELIRQAAHLFPGGQQPWVVDITPVIGAHIGPGAVGLAALQAHRQGAKAAPL